MGDSLHSISDTFCSICKYPFAIVIFIAVICFRYDDNSPLNIAIYGHRDCVAMELEP